MSHLRLLGTTEDSRPTHERNSWPAAALARSVRFDTYCGLVTNISFPRPTPNLLSMNDRHHWRRRSSDVKAWRGAAFYPAYYEARKAPYPPSMVCVTIDVPDARRRDPANYFATVKPIVDGLVDAGWWPDDTPEWVTVIEPVLRNVGRKAPLMVTVELRPR